MTPLHRKTTYLVAISTVAAALGGFLLAGSAIGSDWTTYEGRVTAGQAYLVSVPEDADGLQLEFVPGLLSTSGAAHATLFDPEDVRVGHYMLDDEEKTVSIEAPESGDYVLYVFDVQGGVLTVALKADDADDLELVPLETVTTNHEILGQSIPGAFRAVDTVTLDREPVYESLLYQGSAENMSGSASSTEGVTSAIEGETGTAHGPGLFTSQSGERESFPENFAAGLHTVDVTADEFEGTLFLTTVDYVRPEEVHLEHVDAALPENVIVFHDAWEATAVEIPDGASSLDLGLLAVPEEHEHEDEYEGDYYEYEVSALLSVFTPDDRLLGFVSLDEETPTASLPLEGAGEYVVFVYHAPGDEGQLYAALDQGLGAFGAQRHLRVAETATPLAEVVSPTPYSGEFAHEVFQAPIAAGIGIEGEPSYAVELQGTIHTDAGEARTWSWDFTPVSSTPFAHGWEHATIVGPELVTGPWIIDVEALSAFGSVTLYTLDYDRVLGDEVEAEDEGA